MSVELYVLLRNFNLHIRENFLVLSGQLRINSMIIYMEISLKFVRIIILSHMYWVKLNSMLHHKGG
jgi:hypothetical protein